MLFPKERAATLAKTGLDPRSGPSSGGDGKP